MKTVLMCTNGVVEAGLDEVGRTIRSTVHGFWEVRVPLQNVSMDLILLS